MKNPAPGASNASSAIVAAQQQSSPSSSSPHGSWAIKLKRAHTTKSPSSCATPARAAGGVGQTGSPLARTENSSTDALDASCASSVTDSAKQKSKIKYSTKILVALGMARAISSDGSLEDNARDPSSSAQPHSTIDGERFPQALRLQTSQDGSVSGTQPGVMRVNSLRRTPSAPVKPVRPPRGATHTPLYSELVRSQNLSVGGTSSIGTGEDCQSRSSVTSSNTNQPSAENLDSSTAIPARHSLSIRSGKAISRSSSVTYPATTTTTREPTPSQHILDLDGASMAASSSVDTSGEFMHFGQSQRHSLANSFFNSGNREVRLSTSSTPAATTSSSIKNHAKSSFLESEESLNRRASSKNPGTAAAAAGDRLKKLAVMTMMSKGFDEKIHRQKLISLQEEKNERKKNVDILIACFPDWTTKRGITSEKHEELHMMNTSVDPTTCSVIRNIVCDNQGRITELNLHNVGLTGEIPRYISMLTELKRLTLSKNKLSGPILPDLMRLTKLEALILSHNNLTGNIPADIGDLKNLSHLAIDNNRLTGPVPFEVGKLMNLEVLYLEKNKLTGSVPQSLQTLRTLYDINLTGNKFDGTNPTTTEELRAMRFDPGRRQWTKI